MNGSSDAATVRHVLEIIHTQAACALHGAERPGYLQLVVIHPASGSTVATRFRIGDVDGMLQAALVAAETGYNVYIEPRTIAEHAPRKGRGGIEDTRGVF